MTNIEVRLIELSTEGQDYATNGTPERQYCEALEPNVQTPKADVEAKIGAQKAKIGFGKAMKQKWIKGDKTTVTRIVTDIVDKDQDLLRAMAGTAPE